ncbi:hypothetical protein BG910_06300 [Neisseria chenwenguii]|uniref:Uncharacterized protein n=1 Tax=Neisseria chenwenguii TaxID=1853278 RepID=A0A220S1P0_9NEIS|nr:hypothetical protein BG910_06300 [Neisseria chenwenguii]ROV56927.1 hypothetical protein EGS38_01890 [Neisseria chenwenguii]
MKEETKIFFKMFFISSVIFCFLHWFVYPLLKLPYNQYVLDGIAVLIISITAAYLEKKRKNKN